MYANQLLLDCQNFVQIRVRRLNCIRILYRCFEAKFNINSRIQSIIVVKLLEFIVFYADFTLPNLRQEVF